MGYKIKKTKMDSIFQKLSSEYEIFAPQRFTGKGRFAETDAIRYGKINSIEEIEFDQKSDFSFKEVLLPLSETLYYFTENEMKETNPPSKKAIIFLRSCDLHGLKRLDTIYLENGPIDPFYKRMRDNTRFVLIGCPETFENCFCVSMGTNQTDDYDAYIKVSNDHVFIDSQWEMLDNLLQEADTLDVIPDFVTENEISVEVPKKIPQSIFDSELWDDYANRCIACGRCNFVCPTCTCFTMQDIHYKDNEKTGERRRVWASCHVDSYTDMAGGHGFRENKGARMRFKTMHKINDYNRRFGHQMCIGCGRCDDICPEYISFSNCINKVNALVKEER